MKIIITFVFFFAIVMNICSTFKNYPTSEATDCLKHLSDDQKRTVIETTFVHMSDEQKSRFLEIALKNLKEKNTTQNRLITQTADVISIFSKKGDVDAQD